MATCDMHSCGDFSKLPAELLRAIYREAGSRGSTLSQKDRVVALGVCKGWQAALKDLPLARLLLSSFDKDCRAVCKWALLTRPSVLELQAYGADTYADLLPLLLHALPHKALRKLVVSCACGELIKALPFPAVLPNLEGLDGGQLPPDPAWLGQLTALQQLTQLKLHFARGEGTGAPASDSVQLPPLPSLASLSVWLAAGSPELQLHLGRLPALQELNVSGGSSRVEVLPASAPAAKLRSLWVDVRLLQLDFAQLPALESARLGGELTQLQSAASIAACSSLSRLHLGYSEFALWKHLGYPWVAQLLGNVPSCLRQLSVRGLWTAEAAAAAGALSQLEDLSLGVAGTVTMPLPPEGAAVWNNLRAFKLGHGNFGLSLPKALRCSTRLEALHVRLSVPSIEDLDLISSLPCLRKLTLEGSKASPGVSEAAKSSTLKVLKRLMPQLQQVSVD